MKPTISIIIPCHTNDYFVECLESVATQTDKDFTTIVVFDKCTDNAPQIAEAYRPLLKDLRVYYTDGGKPSVARNKGLKECETDYFWFIDSDDAITHTAIETIKRNIENTTQYYNVIPNVLALMEYDTTQVVGCQEADVAPNHKFVWVFLYVINTAFARAYDLYFDERFTYLEDFVYSQRLMYENYLHSQFKMLDFFYIRKPLYWHRINENSMCQKDPFRHCVYEYETRFLMYEHLAAYTDKIILDYGITNWLWAMCRIITEQAYYKKIPFTTLLKKDLPEIKRLAKGRNRLNYQLDIGNGAKADLLHLMNRWYNPQDELSLVPLDTISACRKIYWKEVYNANVKYDKLQNLTII